MSAQFDRRRDGPGWTVFDRWTRDVVVIAACREAGRPRPDAGDLGRGPDNLAGSGERTLRP